MIDLSMTEPYPHFYFRHLTLYGVRILCCIAFWPMDECIQVSVTPKGWNNPLDIIRTYPRFLEIDYQAVVEEFAAEVENAYRDADIDSVIFPEEPF